MPVIVPCPKCGVKLSAPESAAGKRIRCTIPGCAAITVVPDFIQAEVLEVVDAILSPPGPSDEALPEQSVDKDRLSAARETDRRRGGGRNRRREPDLDDDRPRAGRRKKAQKGKSAVAIAGCGFVFLAAAALGIYLITF